MKTLSLSLRENRSENNQVAYKAQQTGARQMYGELLNISTEEDRIADSHVPTSVRSLAKSHKVQRGFQSQDKQIATFFSIANRDNNRLAQRDQRKADREAKKLEKRLAAIR